MTKWVIGLVFGLLGTVFSGWTVAGAAGRWREFSDGWLFIPAVVPFIGFLTAFVRSAKSRGQWPLTAPAERLLFDITAAAISALSVYLAFVVISYTWHGGKLPPERASLGYLVAHPSEVPPLTMRTVRPGLPDVEEELNWQPRVVITFITTMFVAAVGSVRREQNDCL